MDLRRRSSEAISSRFEIETLKRGFCDAQKADWIASVTLKGAVQDSCLRSAVRFVISFPLLNGCNPCSPLYFVILLLSDIIAGWGAWKHLFTLLPLFEMSKRHPECSSETT